AEIITFDSSYKARAPRGLHGAEITLRFPSVGATENTLLASVLAKGKTVIRNAALEPEIIDLIKFLQKMGGIVELGANRVIYIEGVERLRGVKHRVIPDRNEAVSFACLAIATDGDIFVKDAVQEHLITFLNTIRRIGGDYEVKDQGIRFWRAGGLKATKVETDTHPGFMTDWQQPLAILLTQARGLSEIHETIYEDRFGYTKDLNLMGADIKVITDCSGRTCRFAGKFSHIAVISGPTPLQGTELEVPDLRAGMAHLTAALIAEGESEVSGVEEIDRGYERIDERLKYLGADIKRVE
ncbi:MAG: UDP-N-acetylglucosamine 1-carboxyvinyltransferase, partial [Patescibacteria group bacterium]|nr:UDP-N-acetylglucosamine 1-carboxyvinyltransferase [Patescibacteria group bacterium]